MKWPLVSQSFSVGPMFYPYFWNVQRLVIETTTSLLHSWARGMNENRSSFLINSTCFSHCLWATVETNPRKRSLWPTICTPLLHSGTSHGISLVQSREVTVSSSFVSLQQVSSSKDSWKCFGSGKAICRTVTPLHFCKWLSDHVVLQFLACVYVLPRWLTNAHEFAALAYIRFTVNVQAIGAAPVRDVQHIQETAKLFCPLYICPKPAASRPPAWQWGDMSCI